MTKKDVNKIVQNYPYFMPRNFDQLLKWLQNFAVAFKNLEGKYGITKEMSEKVSAIASGATLSIQAVIDLTALLKKWMEARDLMVGTDPDPLGVDVQYPGDFELPVLPAVIQSGDINYIIQMAKRLDVRDDLSAQDRIALGLVKPAPRPSNRKETAEKLPYPFTELVQVDNDAVLRVTRGDRYRGLMLEIRVDMNGDGVFVPFDKNMDKETVIGVDFKPGEAVKVVSVTSVYLKNGKAASEWSPVQSIPVQRTGPAGPVAAPPVE